MSKDKVYKIARKAYSYECGDGCCSEHGEKFFVDGVEVAASPCENSNMLAVLAAVGIKAVLVDLNEDGEEVSELSNYSEIEDEQN
jgi:hypothetical protein